MTPILSSFHVFSVSPRFPFLFFSTQKKQNIAWVSEWVKSLSHVQLFPTPWTVADQIPPSMGFSRQEYWSGLPFPSPGDLPNPGLPHCRQILYQLSHKGSPRILEWVAYPFSRGSSRPRNWTRISCIADGFLPTELSGKPDKCIL